MNRLIVVPLLLLYLLGFAQEEKKKARFTSINSVGLVNGDNATTGLLQSVNGFQKNGWFAGVGVGLDYYLYRTVPVFAEFRKAFGEKKNRPFVYVAGGINFPWENLDDGWTDYTFYNGLYTDAGLGISFCMKNKQAFVVSLGHSMKNLKETRKHDGWWWDFPNIETFQYRTQRLLLKFGWRF